MKLEIIDVKLADLRTLLNDPNVYVIQKGWFDSNRARLTHISDAETKHVLSDKNLVVRITLE
jgi:hypothetical protein